MINNFKLSFFLLLSTNLSIAQGFEDITPVSISNFRSGDVRWVDIDTDGDLDIYISGSGNSLQNTSIYINDAGSFTNAGTMGLKPLRRTSSAWGDIDNDGDVDVVRSGLQGGDGQGDYFSTLAINAGVDGFIEIDLLEDDAITSGDIELADFDNDGDLDILLVGTNKNRVSESIILINNGNLQFSKIVNFGIRGLNGGNLEIGDFDLDGDVDVLMAGTERQSNSQSTDFVSVFRNAGDFQFEEIAVDINATPFDNDTNWRDINNDGYLDIITTGRVRGSNFSIAVSLGSPSGFDYAGDLGLAAVSFDESIDFADYNNDGFIDVILTGNFSGNLGVKIFQNQLGLSFTEVTNINLFDYRQAVVDVGDFDSDNDQDLVIIGYDQNFQRTTKLYKNSTENVNIAPTVPSGLNSITSFRSSELSWEMAADDKSAAESISYNIYVGSTPKARDILSPPSFLLNEALLIPSTGNAGNSNKYQIDNLPNGTYYWSVQAIDNGMNSSEFSEEQSFVIDDDNLAPKTPTNLVGELLITNKIRLSWVDISFNETEFVIERSIGTSDNFHVLTSLAKNSTSYLDDNVNYNESYYYRLQSTNTMSGLDSDYTDTLFIETQSEGVFTYLDTLSLTRESKQSTSVSIVDYDNDGWDDIFFMNIFNKSSFFKNLGGNNYRRIEENDLVDLTAQTRTSTWADVNNDNLPDAFISKTAENHLYTNNSGDAFSRVSQTSFVTNSDSNGATFGDINGDGFLDVYVASSSSEENLYINNTDESFTSATSIDFEDVSGSPIDAVFIDMNNDLSPDLFVAGYFETNAVYFNDDGQLVLQANNDLMQTSNPSVGSSWADYDNDGDFDVLVTNNVNASDEFYINDGDGNFTRVSNRVTQDNIRAGSSAWIDYDNDGWEDLILVSDAGKFLYRNENGQFDRIEELALSSTPYSTAVAISDLDKDGFLDVVISNSVSNEFLLNNGGDNNYLTIKAVGNLNNSSAIGAKIVVAVDDKILTKQVVSNSGENGQSSYNQHFGLGSSISSDVQVFWPNNGIQILHDVSANQFLVIEEAVMPETPSNLQVIEASNSSIEIAWSDNSEIETGYIIQRFANEKNKFVNIDTVAENIETYLDLLEIAPNSNYRYRVVSFIQEGYSFYSNETEVITPDDVPEDPSGLILNIDRGEISLQWEDNSDNENGFVIQRSVGDNISFEELASVAENSTEFADTSLTPNTTYFYRISAFNEIGNSEFSNEATLTTPDDITAPSDLVLTIGVDEVSLQWEDNSDNENGFVIQRSVGDNLSFEELASVVENSTEFTDTSLTPNTTYFYRINAFNEIGDSEFSNEATLTTPNVVPEVPSDLVLTIDGGEVSLQWKDNSDNENGFVIQRSVGDNLSFEELASVVENSTEFTDTSLTPNTTYFYRINAFNEIGDSEFSNEATLTTPNVVPEFPSDLVLTIDGGEVSLQWKDNSDNENGFVIQRSVGDNLSFEELASVVENSTEFTDTSLTPNTTYFYRINAFNEIGDSEFSNEAFSSIITEIELSDVNEQVTVFPNPAYRYIDIKIDNSEKYKFQFIDQTGKIVKIKIENVKFLHDETVRINIEDIIRGTYFLDIRSSNHLIIKQVILK